MVVVKKSYRTYNEDKLVTFSNTFKVNLVLSVATYPTPPVTELAMKTAIQAYENASETWQAERSSYNAGQTRDRRDELIELLDTQIAYVEGVAPDADSVRSLGLDPAATGPSTAPLPGKPTGEGAVASGEPQSVTVSCKPVKLDNSSAQVSYYVFETNVDGTVQLGLMASGTNPKKLSFGGLTTGKVYYFYIRAKTTAGYGIPSDVIRWVGQ